MQGIPRAAKVYIIGLAVLCVLLLIDACRVPWPPLVEVWLTCVYIGIACAISIRSIQLVHRSDTKGIASISLGFISILFILFQSGIIAGMITAVIGTMITTMRVRVKSIYHVMFNCSALGISAWCSGRFITFFDINIDYLYNKESGFIEIIFLIIILYASVSINYLINNLFVAIVVGLSTNGGWKATKEFWKGNLWLTPIYLAAGSVSIFGAYLAQRIEKNFAEALPILLLSLPIPFVIFQSLKFHNERDIEKQNRLNDLQRQKEEIEQMYVSTVQAFALAIEAKDRYTQEHISRVMRLALGIAREVGLDGEELRAIETGAALHDIGKIAVPEHILNKPGRLTPEEFDIIKRHAEMGDHILQPVHFPYPVIGVVRHHHERWDGKGYPDGLAGEDIPLGARILAVADVYDALTSDRPYREGWAHERAMSHMRSEAGTHFDPAIFAAFEAALDKHPELIAACQQIVESSPWKEVVTVDDVTGLYNKDFLVTYLRRERARSLELGMPISLVVLRLEAWAELSAALESELERRVLSEFAQLLRGALRASDLITRYDDATFVIVLPDTPADDLPTVAANLRQATRAYALESGAGGVGLRLSAALGTATLPRDGFDEGAVLQIAMDRLATDENRLRTEGDADEQPSVPLRFAA